MREEPNIKREITLRVNLLYVLFLVLALCIFGRIVWLQYGPGGEQLRKRARAHAFFMQRIDGKRGEILAANGELLATSFLMYHLGMDFGVDSLTAKRFNAGVDALADSLAELFGDKSKEHYKALLKDGFKKKRYRRLNQRLISYEELARVRTFPLLKLPPGYGGIVTERVYERQRPFGRLAERTLGNTVSVYDTLMVPGTDSLAKRLERMLSESGRTGLEFSYNRYLRGRAGWQMMQRVTERFSTPIESPHNVPTADGRSVVTTLDMDFQDVASSMLAQQLIKHNALYGCVVLMEVATGDIKAIANLENVNGECFERYNYALAGRYEPGSTIKLATLLALLDDGMTLDSQIEVGDGRMILRKASHVDDHHPATPVLTLKRVFETSSNVGFAVAVENRFVATNRESAYVDYLRSLGMGERLGTGISGEASPVLHRPTPESKRKRGGWHANSANYMAYGYGLEISPLHTLTLYNAVANGGKMVRPRLVSELRGLTPEDVEVFPIEVINPSIAGPRTIAAVQESLAGVVEAGTARMLQNPYYKVAAKTGTAQQGSYGGGVGQHYLATMVGYFPADRPQYSCIVNIWTRVGSYRDVYYGSSLAGPVFKAVADRVYVTRWDWQPTVASTTPRTSAPPAIKGGPMRAVDGVAEEMSVRFKDGGIRPRDWVEARLGADSLGVEAVTVAMVNGVVPSVVGMGLKDALFLLESRGFEVEFEGQGRVVEQSPAAGTPLAAGGVIKIVLRND